MATQTVPVNLDVVELDFFELKESFKTFLGTQEEFIDYDFEGSGLSILLDVLSYNTHYMGFYAHMMVNESFLDSAVKRDSVVSHAKELGYIPRSTISATAFVNITINTTDVLPEIVIPKGSRFTTELNDQTYEFVTTESHVALPIGGNQYQVEEVEITQGRYVSFAFVVDKNDPDQRFLIDNPNIDTTTLTVGVQENPTVTDIEYRSLVSDINLLEGNDLIYFLEEAEDGLYEVKFGDNILGKDVLDGNVVVLEYLVSAGEDANLANTFISSSTISGYSNIDVVTVEVASGGAPREDIESIRLNAPRFYPTQNRLVTAEDYRALLAKNSTVINNADSISVWGGEDNDPPIYGKVFMSLKPKLGKRITAFLKQKIIDEVIEKRNVLTILPEIIDPEYLYLEIDVDFEYDPNKTSKNVSDLKDLIRSTITNYNDSTLEFFKRVFRYSTFVALVDATERGICCNLTDIRIKKKFTPTLNVNTQYFIKFNNPIVAGTLQSSKFIINEPTQNEDDVYFFEDDGVGNLILKKQLSDASIVIINEEYGIIDYEEGLVTICSFAPVELINSTEVSISFLPKENDIFSVRNLIITIDDNDVSVKGSVITDINDG